MAAEETGSTAAAEEDDNDRIDPITELQDGIDG